MADEAIQKVILRCFPCEAKDYNKARCRMDTATMSDLGVIIGSSVKIRTGNIYYYCSVWPREGLDRIIQFDNMVFLCLDTVNEQESKNAFLNQASVALSDISKVEPIEAASITVSIKLKDMEDDCSHLSKTVLEKRRERIIKMLLKGLTVAKGCVIKPREIRNYKTSISRVLFSVIIEDTSPEVGDSGCVIVSENSKIKVQSVRMANFVDEDNKFAMAGLDEASQMLKEMLKYPFEYPESFAHMDLECPKGILLQGAPGVGKTLLVRTVTADCKAQLITLNGTDIFGPHSGESEENLRNVFKKACVASKASPCVLFIDEIDALCPKRGTSGSEEENRIVAQLLTLMDGMEYRGKLVVIGATNRPNAIDSALRRPGRFDREIVIGVPSPLDRLAILQAHTKSLHLDKDIDLAHLAEITVGYVGADLASLCREAVFAAMKRNFKGQGHSRFSPQRVNAKASPVKLSDFELAMCHIVPSTQRGMEGLVSLHPTSWHSIGGLQHVKQALMQAIEWPLKHPEAFSRLGVQRPRGVLLYGPPGCCKTTLVKAVASSCHCTFLSLSCAQLYSPYVGDAERMIREVFLKARATAPSILFLDELDSLAGKRSENTSTGAQTRLLASLLNEMDGVGVSANIYDAGGDEHGKEISERNCHDDEENKTTDNSEIEKHTCGTFCPSESKDPVTELGQIKTKHAVDIGEQRLSELQNVKDLILVAATNRPGSIDEALLRPGRIDRIIYVPPPDQDSRLEILKVHTRASPISQDVDLKSVAERTEMFSGADLENLCREAALFALEEKGMSANTIDHKHFTKALATVKPSLTVQQLNYYKNW